MRLTKKKWHQLNNRKKDWFEYVLNKKYSSYDRLYKLGQYEDINDNPDVLAKRDKALEIIKNKAVNLYYVEIVNNYINYNRCIDEFFGNYEHRDMYYLTQEEFNFIKEVLI